MFGEGKSGKNAAHNSGLTATTPSTAEKYDDALMPPDTAAIARMRSPVHLPLTPVGTPEIKPKSAETIHKMTPSGRTIDIMILPKDPGEERQQTLQRTPDSQPKEPPKSIPNEHEQELDGTIAAPADSMKTHVEGMTGHDFLANLPEGVSACPFLEHGCHKAGADMDVKLHIRDDRIYHLVLLCRAVIELRRARIEFLRQEPARLIRVDRQVTPAFAIIQKYGPQCLFHVPKIHDVISEARIKGRNLIFSQPFETHRFGYKMTVLIAPYGDADVVRQYLSVYVTIIKSDYDPIQRWPFSLPITFTLFAADPKQNLEKMLKPNPVPENDAFLGRPKGARNAAFGIQRFCELNDLDRYTIHNDMFLSVHVDLSPLQAERTRRMPSDQM